MVSESAKMAEEHKDTGSLLGRGSEFSGKLTFFGTVRIEGRIEGEIFSDDTLVVAEGGEVKGTVEVGTLIITGGRVEANVKAKKAVEIHAGGQLAGEVSSPIFQIDRGAIFRGLSSMPNDSQKSDSDSG